MEQKYPSRKLTQGMADCRTNRCDKCPAEDWCDDFDDRAFTGRNLLAMHNELDRRQAEIVELNERIDAFIDLVRRMSSKLNEYEVQWTDDNGEEYDDIDADTAALISEAEAMTKEERT